MIDSPAIRARLHHIRSRQRAIAASTEMPPLARLRALAGLEEVLDLWIGIVASYVALAKMP